MQTPSKKKRYDMPGVIKGEDAFLRERRDHLTTPPSADELPDNRFGIALSGGGIRSATINLGFLKTLNKFGLLEQADYVSSVSGGGYTSAYVQGTLRATGSYAALFDEEHVDYMRDRGEYLFPGKGLNKVWNQFVLVVSYLISLVMSLLAPATLAIIGWVIFGFIKGLFVLEASTYTTFFGNFLWYGGFVLAGMLLLHFIINTAYVYHLDYSAKVNHVEAALVVVALIVWLTGYFYHHRWGNATDYSEAYLYLGLGAAILIFGFFANPNATSFHRFYRKQLADAFMHYSDDYRNADLHELVETPLEKPAHYLPPYPLINTTLNLQSSKDEFFQGSTASDYFLLSPLFCGAKLTGYIPTADTIGYQDMTLPAATTISAAAVNPGMGSYSTRLYSLFMTLLNLRLGFWVRNPRQLDKRSSLIWWPSYFFYELLGRIGTDKQMVNISDGGHIENLAVMELLRRKCKLIVAIDAGSDPLYMFADLENLTIRARNELGIDIRFRADQTPEQVIRPDPSHGYSRQRYAVADLYQLWEKKKVKGRTVVDNFEEHKKIGTFVYVKSSIVAPTGRPNISRADGLKYHSYFYKIYHPAFPHESTGDQFFDPVQWESYYQLGQFLAADVLGIDDLNKFDVNQAFTIPLDDFIARCDRDEQLFGSVMLPPLQAPQPPVARGVEEPVAARTPVESYDTAEEEAKPKYEM